MRDVVVLVALAVFVWWIVRRAAREKEEQGRRRGAPVDTGATAAAAPAPAAAAAPSPPEATSVTEAVTVVLRRQVPPRDEPPRSWFGGLPMLPEHVAWPRSVPNERPDAGEQPLHFVAQVACADLPAGLWGVLGPRTGWLLFFLHPNDGTPEELGSHVVLHTDEIGTVRDAPADLGPVHDGVYTGGSYGWLPTEQVPAVWGRWPVDVVTFPNQLVEQDGRSYGTPDDFARTLHDGAQVLDRIDAVAPYTHGQARRALQQLAARMRVGPRPVGDDRALDRLAAGGLAELLAEDGGPVGHVGNADGLLRVLEQERDDVRRWQEEMAARATELEGRLGDDGDPLSAATWDDLRSAFAGEQRSWRELAPGWRPGTEGQLTLRTHRVDAVPAVPRGTTEEATLDWIDSARRALVPADRIDDLAARARSLSSNRPHRMGGYHDGVQSDAVAGPQQSLLLLQLATDDGMDWCWGDAGAYYFFIRSDDLARGDFSRVEMWLECH